MSQEGEIKRFKKRSDRSTMDKIEKTIFIIFLSTIEDYFS